MATGEATLAASRTSEPRPFPLRPLLAKADLTLIAAARALEVDNRQIHRWKSYGLTFDQADELACTLGFHPSEIWPNYTEEPENMSPQAEAAVRAIKSAANNIVWCDPPSGGRGRQPEDLTPILDELRDRPGAWARIAVYDGVTTASSRVGKLRKEHPGFEFTGRRITDVPGKRSGMWARFAGLNGKGR